MGSTAVSSTLARTNLYFALSHEVHLKALLAFAKLVRLERGQDAASRTTLPAGFVFPLDAIVALTGGVEEDGGATLIRFVGNDDFFRIDPVSEVSHEHVVRAGHAVFIDHGTWMRFGSQWPRFLESMIVFTQGRNALAILNATCCSNHRYPKRLARLLLEARRVFPAKDDWLPLTQIEIALLMNTRRETIALEMIELVKAGIVETGACEVQDPRPGVAARAGLRVLRQGRRARRTSGHHREADVRGDPADDAVGDAVGFPADDAASTVRGPPSSSSTS